MPARSKGKPANKLVVKVPGRKESWAKTLSLGGTHTHTHTLTSHAYSIGQVRVIDPNCDEIAPKEHFQWVRSAQEVGRFESRGSPGESLNFLNKQFQLVLHQLDIRVFAK